MKKTMNVENVINHLKKFVSDDDLRPAMQEIHNSNEYLVATNGHILAEISLEEHPKLKEQGANVDRYPNWKTVMPGKKKGVNLPLRVIRTPEDLVPERPKEELKACEECGGDGTTKHNCDCGHCQEDYDECQACSGSGYHDNTPPHVLALIKIGSFYYNPEYINTICDLIESIGAESVDVFYSETGEAKTIAITASGVICLCMPIMVRDYKEEGYNLVKKVEVIS